MNSIKFKRHSVRNSTVIKELHLFDVKNEDLISIVENIPNKIEFKLKSLSEENININKICDNKFFNKLYCQKKNILNIEIKHIFNLLLYKSKKKSFNIQPTFLLNFLTNLNTLFNLSNDISHSDNCRKLMIILEKLRFIILDNEHIKYYNVYDEKFKTIRNYDFYQYEINHKKLIKNKFLLRIYDMILFVSFKIYRLLETRYILDLRFKQKLKNAYVIDQYMKNSSFDSLGSEKSDLNYLYDYCKEKQIYWLNLKKISNSNNLHSKKIIETTLICKICLNAFNAENLQNHSIICKERLELIQESRSLKLEFKKSELMAREITKRLQLENHLEINNIKKIRNTIILNNDYQINSANLLDSRKRCKTSNTYVASIFSNKNSPSNNGFPEKFFENPKLVASLNKEKKIDVKTELFSKLKNLINDISEKNEEKIPEMTRSTMDTRQKKLSIKVSERFKKIKHFELTIESLKIIEISSIDFYNNPYSIKTELEIDQTVHKIRKRIKQEELDSRNLKKAVNLINNFIILIEKYNSIESKILSLTKKIKKSKTNHSSKILSYENDSSSVTSNSSPTTIKNIKDRLLKHEKSFEKKNISKFKEYEADSSFNQDLENSQNINEIPIFYLSQNSEKNQKKIHKSSFEKKFQKINKNTSSSKSSEDEKNLSINLDLNYSEYKAKSAENLIDIEKNFQENHNYKESEININSFDFICLINKGAFGRVWLVKRKLTEDFYAMKIINLLDHTNKNKFDSIKTESEALTSVTNDFVVKSYFSFTHEYFLCLVMEYLYGDFNDILKDYGAFDEKTAKFYIVELIIAVEYLHKIKIIHRDLKPDNILIDKQGHIKLTDFGLSEVCLQRYQSSRRKTYIGEEYLDEFFKGFQIYDKPPSNDQKIIYRNINSSIGKTSKLKKQIIGTPDYIAPEILEMTDDLSSPSLDWWSVGIILFEFLVGVPPFNDDTVDKIFDNIKNGKIPWDQIEIGDGENQISFEAYDLINKLLQKDPKKRIGSKGVDEIKQHNFFKDIDWKHIANMTPPIIPETSLNLNNAERLFKFDEHELKSPFFIKNEENLETKVKMAKIIINNNYELFNTVSYQLLEKENQKNFEILQNLNQP